MRIKAHKLQINILTGLAHTRQNLRCDMLGRHLQLAADMMPDQLLEKLLVFVLD